MNDKYKLPDGGLEVIMMGLAMLEKFGYKYPNIIKNKHFQLASVMYQDLLKKAQYEQVKEYKS